MLRVDLTNEEIVEEIRAGNNAQEYYALLWERNKRFIYYLSSRYKNLIYNRPWVDIDDIAQCGYFALVKAVDDYKPEKGYSFISFINYRLLAEVRSMLGSKIRYLTGKAKWWNPDPTASLNEMLRDGEEGNEWLNMLEDEEAGRIHENCERAEISKIVYTALERLSEKEHYVIHEIYYEEKQKNDIVDGVYFQKYSQVDNVERSAILKLRRDKAIRALYYDCYWKEPESPSPYSNNPEKVVIADETMCEWLKHISREMGKLNHGLQTTARDSYYGIRAV